MTPSPRTCWRPPQPGDGRGSTVRPGFALEPPTRLTVCLGHARTLDAFAFGQDATLCLGVSVARTRLVLLCTTALLTATLVSSAGAIGFVGPVLPHAARVLTGPGRTRLLPATALTGAVFLVWVDTLARTVLDPQEVPVGVVTSLIGVPAFVAALYRAKETR